MTVVKSISLVDQLKEIENLDSAIGEMVSEESRPYLILHLDKLLSKKELEVQKHVEWIHKIYSSRRYRLGHALIKPIEGSLLKIRLIRKNNDSNSDDLAD
jgi:hypothetical protein